MNEHSGNSGQLSPDAGRGGIAPIDVTDPWRGLYHAERLRAPSEYGEVYHPDTPSWPDDREDALDKLVHAQGFDFQIVAGDFSDEALEDGDELYWQEMRAWNPEAPEGDWRLAWKGDTEDGPYAWFVRPMALRPEPEAITAPPAQADRIAIKMLVAAGFVSEDKANESLRIAHGFGGDLGQPATAAVPAETFQAGVSKWMGECFLPSLYSNMTERGDRLLEEVLELLQSHGYDQTRVATLVDYVYGRPIGDPAQEVGGVMVTLAGYCWVAGLDMHAEGARELERITQPEVMAKIRRKQEAKNALHFDTPLPGGAPAAVPVDALREPLLRLITAGEYLQNRILSTNGANCLDQFEVAIDAAKSALATRPQPAAAKEGPR